jgi:hypothetical protein
MASDEPLAADGMPLRRPAAGRAWDEWARWSARVEQRAGNQSRAIDALLNTLERLAEAVVHERRERELEIDKLKVEIDKLKAELTTQRTIAHWLKSRPGLNGGGVGAAHDG